MLSEALSIYRRRFGALVLTCALALLPASLLMAGAVTLGLAGLGAGGLAEAPTHTGEIRQKQRDLREAPPAPEDSAARTRQLGREAFEGGSAFDPGALRTLLTLALASFCAALLLLAGLWLAHAAATPLVLGTAGGPAQAWAAVAPRLGALVGTALLGVPLVALGTLFLLAPGLVLAVGFALAMPVVMTEGLSGRAALERSWALSRGRRGPILGMLALVAVFLALGSLLSMLAPAGPWRAVVAGALRLLAVPLPLAGLCLLYRRAVSTSAGAPPPDSSARGSPGSLRP